MPRRRPLAAHLLVAAGLITACLLAPLALADKGGTPHTGGGNGGGGSATTMHGGPTTSSGAQSASGTTSGCTPAAPGVFVDNNYAWATPGSWGLPGQQLKYGIQVSNHDVGCGSSSFLVSLSAPDGFAVSIPTDTITLSSSSGGYVWAYVSSPTVISDGSYQLTASVARVGATTTAPQASATSYYLVYSSDTVAPTLYYPNPWDGETISGSSYTVVVSASDDHAVKTIALYIDGSYRSTSVCDDISYTCQLSYKWPLKRLSGQHTATFTATDWMGNVGALTVTFTISKK